MRLLMRLAARYNINSGNVSTVQPMSKRRGHAKKQRAAVRDAWDRILLHVEHSVDEEVLAATKKRLLTSTRFVNTVEYTSYEVAYFVEFAKAKQRGW